MKSQLCQCLGPTPSQERSSANAPTVSYTRGSDLSGTFEGAGGIGGLLARSHNYVSGTGAWNSHGYYHADGGGNITYLANPSQGLAASYKYDPFGNTIALSGTNASANVYRFSSKEYMATAANYYYGYRFYDPNLQRWLNRDPLLERGFLQIRALSFAKSMPYLRQTADQNLYRFVLNDPIRRIDPLGLYSPACQATLIAYQAAWLAGDSGAMAQARSLWAILGCDDESPGGPRLPGPGEEPYYAKPRFGKPNPQWNRGWVPCTAGGPVHHFYVPFQFPELDPEDKIALFAAATAGLVGGVGPFLIGGGTVAEPILIALPAFGF